MLSLAKYLHRPHCSLAAHPLTTRSKARWSSLIQRQFTSLLYHSPSCWEPLLVQGQYKSETQPGSGYLPRTQVLASLWTLLQGCSSLNLIESSGSISPSELYFCFTYFCPKYFKKHKEVFICRTGIAQYSSGIMTRLTWNAYFLSSHKIFKN